MRILIVTQYYWPEHFRINDLAKGLVERNHEVTVLTGSPNYPGGRFFNGYGIFNRSEIHDGISIIRVPLIPRGKSSSIQLILNYISFSLSASLLGPLLCKGDFDIIFVFQVSPVTVAIPAILLKFLKGAPLFMWILDLWPESVYATTNVSPFMLNKPLSTLIKFIYRSCDRILISSNGFRNSVESRGVHSSRVLFLPNWVEPIHSLDDDVGIDLPQGFRICFAGNIGVSQDFSTILSAAELLRDNTIFHWIIVGDGRQLEWLQKEISRRNLTTSFHLIGRMPSDFMPFIFNSVDALLVTLKPDPVFSLTIPGKVQSYMASGKPIIAALEGVGAEIILDSGSGYVVEPGNAEALANAIIKLQLLPLAERNAIGLRGIEYSNIHYDRNMLFNRLETWMTEACMRYS